MQMPILNQPRTSNKGEKKDRESLSRISERKSEVVEGVGLRLVEWGKPGVGPQQLLPPAIDSNGIPYH